MRVDIHRVWEKHILPEWEKMISRPETRELWWRGVAPRCRGAVWAKAFGNSLAISEDTFRLALKRAKAADAEARNSPSVQSTRDGEMFSAIRRDVNDTFPDLKIFQASCPSYVSVNVTSLLNELNRNKHPFIKAC